MVEITDFPNLPKFDGSETGHVVAGGNSRGYDMTQLKLFFAAPAADWRDGCRVASTANIDLATALEAGDSIDGVVLAEGDRVLAKDQTVASENGVYVAVAAAAGAASRTADFDIQAEVLNGAAFYVFEGTANARKAFSVTSADPHVVDTDAITFAEFTPALGGAVEVQEAGVQKVSAATILNMASGATVADAGGGQADITIAGGGGGGGGSGIGVADIVSPPTAGWTLEENGVSTTTALDAGKFPSVSKVGPDGSCFYSQPMTGGVDFDLYFDVSLLASADSFCTAAVGVGRVSDSKRLIVGYLNAGELLVQRWTGGTFDATQFSVPHNLGGVSRIYVNIKRTTGTLEFRVSPDGLSWSEVVYSETVAAHVGETDEYGLFLSTAGVTAGQETKIALKGIVDRGVSGEPAELLGGAAAKKYCIVGSSAQTALNFTAGVVPVPWNIEVSDINGWHDNVTQNSRITPTGVTAEFVDIHVSLNFANVTLDVYTFVNLHKNGVRFREGTGVETGVSAQSITGSWLQVPFTAGDYFEIVCTQQTDTSIDMTDLSEFLVREA